MLGATIEVNGVQKHTYKDWGLKWTDVSISSPEAKIYKVNVPFSDSCIDLTEAILGDVKYKNRTIELEFEVDGDFLDWQKFYSEYLNFCHGRTVKLILDTDLSFYWKGRLNLSSTKKDYTYGTVTLEIDVEPYKYEICSGTEDWLWDPFDFRTGIIRNYKDLTVNGTLWVTIQGLRKVQCLKITSNAAMIVTFNNKNYTVPKGTSELLDVQITQGENKLLFTGKGLISIDYRGGSL